MDAPRCRLCGNRHWGVCAGIANRDMGIVANSPEKPKVVANRVKVVANKPKSRYKDKESRRIYMRDLMRGLREEKKCDCVYDMLLENMGGVPTELSVA